MRLGVFTTHPVQYTVPLWRALARTPGLEVVVHYFSDISLRGGLDRDFGVNVTWDVPLLEGYEHTFVSRDCAPDDFKAARIADAPGLLRAGRFDVGQVGGYMYRFERQVVAAARKA